MCIPIIITTLYNTTRQHNYDKWICLVRACLKAHKELHDRTDVGNVFQWVIASGKNEKW